METTELVKVLKIKAKEKKIKAKEKAKFKFDEQVKKDVLEELNKMLGY